jgi:hypothetical protein
VLLLANGKETEDGNESPRGLLLIWFKSWACQLRATHATFAIVPQPQGDPHTLLGNFNLTVAALQKSNLQANALLVDSRLPVDWGVCSHKNRTFLSDHPDSDPTSGYK